MFTLRTMFWMVLGLVALFGAAVAGAPYLRFAPGPSAVAEANAVATSTIQTHYLACLHSNDQGFERSDFDCLAQATNVALDAGATPNLLLSSLVKPQAPDFLATNCHDVAHVVGEEVAKRYPLEKALSMCTNDCRAGCVHGAIGEGVSLLLGNDAADLEIEHRNLPKVLEIGKTFCTESGAVCHGIGHLVFMATQNITDALSACMTVGGKNNHLSCDNGAFMEAAGENSSLTYKAAPLANPNEDYGYPCNVVPLEEASACYYSQMLFQQRLFEQNKVPVQERLALAVHSCGILTGQRRSDCFSGMGQKIDFAPQILGVDAAHLCVGLAFRDQVACSKGALMRYAENQDTVGRNQFTDSLSPDIKAEINK